MERIAFRMKLHAGQAEEYKRRHSEIWPELIQLLKKTGIQDYTIFLDEETNSLFATFEVDSIENLESLPNSEIMKKWWKYMADIMDTLLDNSPVSVALKKVFYLR